MKRNLFNKTYDKELQTSLQIREKELETRLKQLELARLE